jgi:vacuolar-type H+-ATPase subunit E/Vma4
MTTGPDKIERKIREAGEKEMEEIGKEAEARILQIRKEIEEEAEKAHAGVLNDRRKEIELIPRRILSEARLERKKKVDSKKTEMVEAVFSQAESRVMGMGRRDAAAIMKRLADKGAENIADPVFYVDKEYADLLEGAKAEKIGVFGVIVRNKEGTSSVDNTLNAVMDGLRLALKPAIVKIMFKD